MSDDQVLTGPGTQTRRILLAGAGALGASVVLAACGGGDSTVGDTPTSGGPAVSGSSDAGGDRDASNSLATTGDIPVGGGAVFASQGVVITQPNPGEFKGFSPICPHQGCPVSNVNGGTINCTCHGSRFSISDGSVRSGPATRSLAPRELKVDGDRISFA